MENRFGNIGKGVKVVVDSANATGGVIGPELYRKLGCDVIELFSKPDGTFPNHHPNPSVEKTLDTLKEVVVENKADIGIAYDGDSDSCFSVIHIVNISIYKHCNRICRSIQNRAQRIIFTCKCFFFIIH